jgi:drug/metabolite transporter (DMT)-like permease
LTNIISLLTFTLTLAAGQLLFKQTALGIRGLSLAEVPVSLARMPSLYLALFLYGCSTLLWIWILSRMALAQAYPWIAVGMIIVPLLGVLIFGEKLAPLFWVGASLILVGMILTQYGAPG